MRPCQAMDLDDEPELELAVSGASAMITTSGQHWTKAQRSISRPKRKDPQRYVRMSDESRAPDVEQCADAVDKPDALDTHPTGASMASPSSLAVQHQQIGKDYRADVDGLRAVAVIVVIIFHINAAWLQGGFVGVDVFFVISGYVVCGTLLRGHSSSTSAFLGAFYARRIKRLGPALLSVIFVTSLLTALIIPTWSSKTMLNEYYFSGQLAVIGLANQHYATLPHGYFDEGQDGLKHNPFTHN
eukprot:6805778-Prymnesium_polylepis.1